MKINLSTPYFFGNEIKNLNKSVKKKWISSSGSASQDFENKVKKYIKDQKLKTSEISSLIQIFEFADNL